MPDFLAEALTWPENYEYLLKLRAAFMYRERPTYVILPVEHQLNKREVHHLDQMLMSAHQILKDETCNSCGVVAWHGRTANSTIEYEEKESTCESCAAKEREDKARSSNKRDKNDEGVTRYIVPRFLVERPDGKMVHTDKGPTRRQWQEEMMADMEKERRERDQQ